MRTYQPQATKETVKEHRLNAFLLGFLALFTQWNAQLQVFSVQFFVFVFSCIDGFKVRRNKDIGLNKSHW